MHYWIITDTHFDHEQMVSHCGRPKDFNEIILKNLYTLKKYTEGVLIHLGDIAWQRHSLWNMYITSELPNLRKWLCFGNHDKHGIKWHIDRGWDFAGETISLKIYGKNILFSHRPHKNNGYDLNIHGHFHNTDHRSHEPELIAIKNDKQYLLAIELTDYKPVTLQHIVSKIA